MGKRKRTQTPQQAAQSLRSQIELVRTKLDQFERDLDNRFPIKSRRSVKAIVKTARGKALHACRRAFGSRAMLIVALAVGLAIGAAL